MDGITTKATLAIGAVVLIALLWLTWKFFARLFKHVVIMLMIGSAGAAFYYYRSLPPPPPYYVGKHAYMKETGAYIGVVEGQGEDNRRGPVWIVRPVGGYPQKYAKSRVTLKDKLEIVPDQTPVPATELKPAANRPAANKLDKGKN